jgi:1-acyl-sn-glycerol-3-phosphate acyltransferase
VHTHDVPNADTLAVPPTPTKADVDAALRLMMPLRKVIKPKVYGIDNVPKTRALLVGNHNTLGMVDAQPEADPNRSLIGRLLRSDS